MYSIVKHGKGWGLNTTTNGGKFCERDGFGVSPVLDSSNPIIPPVPTPTVPANGTAHPSGDVTHREEELSVPSNPFVSLAKMIGLEDPEDVQPYLDTMTHLQLVISNLECFKFTEQRKTAMKKMLEDIRQRLEE